MLIDFEGHQTLIGKSSAYLKCELGIHYLRNAKLVCIFCFIRMLIESRFCYLHEFMVEYFMLHL